MTVEAFTLAVIQNRPGYDKEKNIEDILRLIARARAKGADAVLLPEMSVFPYDMARLKEAAETDGRTRGRLAEAARKHKLYLCTGSLPEMDNGRIFNRACLLGPDGETLLTHDKCHLFDVRLPSLPVTESDLFTPGGSLAVTRTPLAVFGLLVCYDIRFPEAARKLALGGAEVLLVPAAFNTVTGPAHWHLLFRSRAAENQCFIAAASPARDRKMSYRAYGHSLIVDPWGKILTEAGTGPALRLARLSPDTLRQTRERLPLLRQRRPELY